MSVKNKTRRQRFVKDTPQVTTPCPSHLSCFILRNVGSEINALYTIIPRTAYYSRLSDAFCACCRNGAENSHIGPGEHPSPGNTACAHSHRSYTSLRGSLPVHCWSLKRLCYWHNQKFRTTLEVILLPLMWGDAYLPLSTRQIVLLSPCHLGMSLSWGKYQ